MNDNEEASIDLRESDDPTVIAKAIWPDACPHPLENFLSVVVGNTSIHWAAHYNLPHKYSPHLFWKTRVDAIEPDVNHHGVAHQLQRYLPMQVATWFFPPAFLAESNNSKSAQNENDSAAILAYMATKRIPAVTVYVISTNPDNLNVLQNLLHGLPCRIVCLQAIDFVSSHHGGTLPYPTVGVDRMAACQAIRLLQSKKPPPAQSSVDAAATLKTSSPAGCYLIVDGGTAMTTTLVGPNGEFLGGGIGPGLGAKFRALHEFTGALPEIPPDRVVKYVRSLRSSKQTNPLSMFASNTEEAMIGAVLNETAAYLYSVVNCWMQKVDTPTADAATAMMMILKGTNKQEESMTSVAVVSEAQTTVSPPQQKQQQQQASLPSASAGQDDTNNNGSAQTPQQQKTPPPQEDESKQNAATVTSRDHVAETDVDAGISSNGMGSSSGSGGPCIYVTGSDGEILMALLASDRERIVEAASVSAGNNKTEPALKYDKFLLHRGIQQLLLERQPDGAGDDDMAVNELRYQMIGQRVAKLFDCVDDTGDYIFRGTVVSATHGETALDDDRFLVLYDDGDREEMFVDDLRDALKLYGKMWEKRVDPLYVDSLAQKRKDALEAAKALSAWIQDEQDSQKKQQPTKGRRVHESLLPPESLSPPALDDTSGKKRKRDAQAWSSPDRKNDTNVNNDDTGASAVPSPSHVSDAATQQQLLDNGLDDDHEGAVAATVVVDDKEAVVLDSTNNNGAAVVGASLVSKRIAKHFELGLFFGTVDEYMPADNPDEGVDLWHILYDDGDSEDMENAELQKHLELYRVHASEDSQFTEP